MAKKILTGIDALQALARGVSIVATATGKTLGPSGRNVVYERLQTNLPVSTRDGVTCMQQFDLEDPFEQMGARMVRGVSEETVDSAGDGTTTAAILTQAIFSEGLKAIVVGANPVALKRGIEQATIAVVGALKDMSVPVRDKMIEQVATISANNDPFLGGLIAAAMEKSGKDGVVTVEVSRTPDSSLVISDGMQIGAGYISQDFVTNRERGECVLEDCYIFLHEKRLSTILPMAKLLKELTEEGKSVLIVADDVTDEALNVLAIAAQNIDQRYTKIRCCAVKTPGSVEFLHDIAALTGASVITELLPTKLKDVTKSYFGHAKRVVVKAHSTTILSDAKGDRLTQRLQELRNQVTEATDEVNRIKLQSRLARLAGGVAIIRIGAATELEMLERKDRIEDAMHATRCAISEGVVPGGGVALSVASRLIPKEYDEEAAGMEIVRKACLAPLRTLAENGGEPADFVTRKVLTDSINMNYGWNARTGEFGDMYEMGIIDPLRVVRVALESAASVAALMLITNCLVANERPK